MGSEWLYLLKTGLQQDIVTLLSERYIHNFGIISNKHIQTHNVLVEVIITMNVPKTSILFDYLCNMRNFILASAGVVGLCNHTMAYQCLRTAEQQFQTAVNNDFNQFCK